jgi:hypothetical protein
MTSSFRWRGRRPGFFLWRKFLSKINDIPKDGVLEILSYETLINEKIPNLKWKNNNLYYRREIDQLVTKNGLYERGLLKKSLLNIFPHEVCQILAHTNFGVTLHSNVIHGGASSINSFEKIIKLVLELKKEATKKGLGINSFEINHTHPSIELKYSGPKKFTYFMNGLSLSDLKFASNLRRWCGPQLLIKAITPNGFSYSHHLV